MTPEESQRKEELECTLNFFRHHFGQVPEFEPLPTNSRPDVCVHFQNKRIGIELTRAIDSTKAVVDSFSAAFLDAARIRHAELGGLPGRVSVSFRHKFNPNVYHRKDLGTELGEIVASLWKAADGLVIIRPEDLPPKLREIVTEVRAFGHEGATYAHWTTVVSAWVQGITAEKLQPIIEKKEKELPAYQQMGCDELWLLIYARVGKSAEVFDEARGFDPSQLRSNFHRTFFYDWWRSKELATATDQAEPASGG